MDSGHSRDPTSAYQEPVLDKAPDAFRTISEVGDELDIPQHVLRFWETRFSQIKPMKRSGGRRFYRPDDVDLLRGIRRLLYGEGYTIRGVQRILKEQGIKSVQVLSDSARAVPSLYALDDGVKQKLPRVDGDPTDEDEPHLDDVPEPVAPPPRRPMATPLPRVDPVPRVAPPMRSAPELMSVHENIARQASLAAEQGLARPLERAVEPRMELPLRPPVERADDMPSSVSRPPVAAPPKPDRRPLDIIRLKAVMSDLIVCREMLDRALQDT